MKRFKPMLAIVICVFAAGLWISPALNLAWAGKLTLTFATTTPPKSNLEIASQKFVETIAAKTGGRIEIKHYGTGSLYNAKTIMPAISKDQVDIGILHVALVGRRSPVLEFIGSFGAQGCWTDNDHYFRFLDDSKIRTIASNEFEEFFNSKLLAPLTFGTGLMGRRDKVIEKVSDFKGLKMRTSGTAQATMYKALGAVPVGLSSKEIYTALQRGTIQGATSGVARWRRSKLYEVAPYLTIDPTLPYLSMWLVINNKAWAKLSADDQKIFMETAKELEQWTRDFAEKETRDDMAFLKKEAKSLLDLSPGEKTLLIDTVKPAMKDLAKSQLKDRFEELWGLLEKSR
ncbi:MAG: TRAP transporter substrate-binding protein [Desulfobacteraceae bacterium]|nr:TRAP transporter substrate-binding protein [Desulfobacteraceae bacterium]